MVKKIDIRLRTGRQADSNFIIRHKAGTYDRIAGKTDTLNFSVGALPNPKGVGTVINVAENNIASVR